MWKRSFVATAVALGGTVDDALASIGGRGSAIALPTGASGVAPGAGDGGLDDLVTRLRAPQRGARAAALATAVRDVVLAIDRTTLR
jgi:hypothetical protein